MLPLLLFGAVFYVITLGINYSWLAWLIIATAPSALILPGLPGRPFMWEAGAMAAWCSLIVLFALRREKLREIADRDLRRALLCLGFYVATLLLVMSVRGVGFRVFGGAQMGGRFYVQQLVLSVLPLLLAVVPWTERHLLRAVFASIALSGTYLVSDLALIRGGGVADILLRFLEVPTDAINFYVGYEFTGVRRFQSFAIVSDLALMGFLMLVPLRSLAGRWSFVLLPLLLGLAALGLASGHRTIFVIAAVMVAILGVFQRIYTPGRLLVILCLMTVLTAGLYRFADRLPLGMQRAVSFLPGIEVSAVAANDAQATIRDRVEALKLGLRDAPEYFLVGRGFGMERLDKRHVGAFDDAILIAYENGYFDNGLLGLLLKLGLFGLAAALAFLFFVTKAALRCARLASARGHGEQDIFDRYCQVIAAKWCATVIFFLLIRGDANTFMQAFALSSSVVFLCLRLQERRAATATSAP